MRATFLLLTIPMLAACDSGTVPSPAEQSSPASNQPQVASNEVLLSGEGLTAGAEAFYFAAGQREVEAALARVLGKASDVGTNEECGAGPVEYAAFPGGLTVNFQNGSLAGWFWNSEAENIAVQDDITIGMPRTTIESEEGFAMVEASTLGQEFSLGDRLGGFVEGDEVSALYAGTQCFFR